jgi:hypothetical protein
MMKDQSGAERRGRATGTSLIEHRAEVQEQQARPCLESDASLKQFLERWVHLQTGGRIHCLEIERRGETIVVRGWARSYCVRLRAVNAICEALTALQEVADTLAGDRQYVAPGEEAEPQIIAFKVENRIVVTSSY